jgi:hypothetical protein
VQIRYGTGGGSFQRRGQIKRIGVGHGGYKTEADF